MILKNEDKRFSQNNRTKSDVASYKQELQKINFESIPDKERNNFAFQNKNTSTLKSLDEDHKTSSHILAVDNEIIIERQDEANAN